MKLDYSNTEIDENLSSVEGKSSYSKWLYGIFTKKGHPKEGYEEVKHDLFDFYNYCRWGDRLTTLLCAIKKGDGDTVVSIINEVYKDRLTWIQMGKTDHKDEGTDFYNLTTNMFDYVVNIFVGIMRDFEVKSDKKTWFTEIRTDKKLASLLKRWVEMSTSLYSGFNKSFFRYRWQKDFKYMSQTLSAAKECIDRVSSCELLKNKVK